MFDVTESQTQHITYNFLVFDIVPLSGDDNLLPRMYSLGGHHHKNAPHFVTLCQADLNEKMTCLSADGGAENAIYTATDWDSETCQVQNISVSASIVHHDGAANSGKLSMWSASEEYRLSSLENPITQCGPANEDNWFWYGEVHPNGDKTNVTCIVGCGSVAEETTVDHPQLRGSVAGGVAV